VRTLTVLPSTGIAICAAPPFVPELGALMLMMYAMELAPPGSLP
jgi:hypothetical protein